MGKKVLPNSKKNGKAKAAAAPHLELPRMRVAADIMQTIRVVQCIEKEQHSYDDYGGLEAGLTDYAAGSLSKRLYV